jgi:spermidine/putrescine transport system substrate-binding protein
MPQPVLDAFTAEYGVKVKCMYFDSQEEAVENIREGKVVYDVAVIEDDYLPSLVKDNLLAELDFSHIPNFTNITPNFRDLAFDPGNKHSIPYNWGTTGLLVRGDLVERPVTSWSDLWDSHYTAKIVIRDQPIEMVSVALKSLGFPLNSEDPTELEKALERLLDLKPNMLIVGVEVEQAVAPLLSGEAVIMVGWPSDAIYAKSQNDAIVYVLPKEGSMLWGDSFVISASSPKKATAELLLNFILRPEISAQIVNAYYNANVNELARPYVDPEIAENPIIYPPMEDI